MVVPDNKDIFIGFEPHERIIQKIKQALSFRETVIKVIGGQQLGKTTLFYQLQVELESKYYDVVCFPQAVMSIDDLNDTLISRLDISVKNDFVAKLLEVLLENKKKDKYLVLLFDDAHQLAPELLAHLRMLTNLQDTKQLLVRVIFFGEQSLDNNLRHPSCYGFEQRVSQSLRLAKITRQQWLDSISQDVAQVRLTVKAAQYAYSISKGKLRYLAIIAKLVGDNLAEKKQFYPMAERELKLLLSENTDLNPRSYQKKSLLALSVFTPILVVVLFIIYLQPSITTETVFNSADKQEPLPKLASSAEAQRIVAQVKSIPMETGIDTHKAGVVSLAEAIAQWEMSWQKQDVNEYLAAYSRHFTPPDKMTLERWSEIRELRVSTPDWIKLSITDVNKVQTSATHAEIEFWLWYQSSNYQDKTLKTLILEKENEEWRIVREINLQLIKL